MRPTDPTVPKRSGMPWDMGPHGETTEGSKGKTWARASMVVSMGKNWCGRVSRFRISLDNFRGLLGTGAVLGCLVPGPAVIGTGK